MYTNCRMCRLHKIKHLHENFKVGCMPWQENQIGTTYVLYQYPVAMWKENQNGHQVAIRAPCKGTLKRNGEVIQKLVRFEATIKEQPWLYSTSSKGTFSSLWLSDHSSPLEAYQLTTKFGKTQAMISHLHNNVLNSPWIYQASWSTNRSLDPYILYKQWSSLMEKKRSNPRRSQAKQNWCVASTKLTHVIAYASHVRGGLMLEADFSQPIDNQKPSQIN